MSDVNVNDNTIFIPEANGNRDKENPITFHIQFLTSAEQSEMEFFQFSGDGKRVKIKTDSTYIFPRAVTSIDNWKGGKTAEDFLRARGPSWMGKMVVEVAKFVYESMEIDEKN
jgi:hypothetical protein